MNLTEHCPDCAYSRKHNLKTCRGCESRLTEPKIDLDSCMIVLFVFMVFLLAIRVLETPAIRHDDILYHRTNYQPINPPSLGDAMWQMSR